MEWTSGMNYWTDLFCTKTHFHALSQDLPTCRIELCLTQVFQHDLCQPCVASLAILSFFGFLGAQFASAMQTEVSSAFIM